LSAPRSGTTTVPKRERWNEGFPQRQHPARQRVEVVVEGNGNDYISARNGADLVVGGLGQHTIQLGNGNDILIDGLATVVNTGDSLRQIVSDWNASPSASVNTRLKVVYNTTHPNVLKAGSGRDWFFYNAPTTSNKKATDRLN
jgi:Ca2+-binding RTX toxin-like protein